MRTIWSAIPAVVLVAAAPAFADASQHVSSAKKAERRGDWNRALEEWKAAYSQDINAEYLIGIGDCYAKLGNTAEAKKNYEAYLADPLALPANASKVKTKIAALDSAPPALALPGAPGGLALPGADAAPPLPVAAETPKKGKKGRKGREVASAEPPALPGLDLPGAAPGAPIQTASAPPALDLPGMAPAPKKEEPKKVASAAPPPLPGLDLPGMETPKPVAKTEPPPAKQTPPVSKPPPAKQIATATPPPKPPEKKKLPEAVTQAPPPRQPEAAGGGSKTLAYVVAGVAVVGLGGGAFMYSKAGSAHSDLTGSVHDRATAQSLLSDEKSSKTLSFIGLAGGLVMAGVATALFAF